jgi:hypothetical protein
MCSCVEAFSSIRACAIIVAGVSCSLPIHGVGTAFFLVLDSLGEEIVIRIHNCLLCETKSEEDTFNLISVSQLLRSKRNSVQFQSEQSTITLSHPRRTSDVILDLVPDDGLYALDVRPMSPQDVRKETNLSFDFTVNEELVRDRPIVNPHNLFPTTSTKSPTKLGIWYTRIL